MLSMLLFALGWKLRLGAGFDKTFRKAIRDAERTVVIRTQDGRSAFSYVFHDGRVSAHRGILEDATVQLVWDDPRIGEYRRAHAALPGGLCLHYLRRRDR